MKNASNEYQYTLYFMGLRLGDYLTWKDAESDAEYWANECESEDAKNIANYEIVPYDGY